MKKSEKAKVFKAKIISSIKTREYEKACKIIYNAAQNKDHFKRLLSDAANMVEVATGSDDISSQMLKLEYMPYEDAMKMQIHFQVAISEEAKKAQIRAAIESKEYENACKIIYSLSKDEAHFQELLIEAAFAVRVATGDDFVSDQMLKLEYMPFNKLSFAPEAKLPKMKLSDYATKEVSEIRSNAVKKASKIFLHKYKSYKGKFENVELYNALKELIQSTIEHEEDAFELVTQFGDGLKKAGKLDDAINSYFSARKSYIQQAEGMFSAKKQVEDAGLGLSDAQVEDLAFAMHLGSKGVTLFLELLKADTGLTSEKASAVLEFFASDLESKDDYDHETSEQFSDARAEFQARKAVMEALGNDAVPAAAHTEQADHNAENGVAATIEPLGAIVPDAAPADF